MPTNIPLPIKCILSEDRETGLWIGRCLDFGLVTSGKTVEDAWTNLKSVVKVHLEHCLTQDESGLIQHRASDEEFTKFDDSSQTEQFRSENIKLNLIAPKVPTARSFWIRGVECETPSHV